MSPSLIRSYPASPEVVLEAALEAATRRDVGVSMVDQRLRYLYLSPGVALSITDNALGGTAVHASWRGSRAWGAGKICRRLLSDLEQILAGRIRPHRGF
ncbi:MAG: hypothetical protein JW785_11850 [Acidimicrobiia bacterium]|nr:hypothetical protein [Acidimicrobiia bacterium]